MTRNEELMTSLDYVIFVQSTAQTAGMNSAKQCKLTDKNPCSCRPMQNCFFCPHSTMPCSRDCPRHGKAVTRNCMHKASTRPLFGIAYKTAALQQLHAEASNLSLRLHVESHPDPTLSSTTHMGASTSKTTVLASNHFLSSSVRDFLEACHTLEAKTIRLRCTNTI